MKRQRRTKRRFTKKRDSRLGAAVVEFAIVANVMVVMTLTCFEFARMNMVRNLSQDAAYFAARQAIVPGATSAEAVDEAERIMDSLISSGYTVTVSDLDEESTEITVTVAVDLTQVAFFAPLFLPDTEIQSVARIRTERYDGFYQQ